MPTASPDATGGLATLMLHPSPANGSLSDVGETAVKAKFGLLSTAIGDVRVEPPAFTVTTPPVTIIPDQVALVLLDVTVLPLPSVNCQPDTLAPPSPVTVQVVVVPLTTGEVQLNAGVTFTVPESPNNWSAHTEEKEL